MTDGSINTDGEEWRDIVGWEGYQVSSLGRIRSLDRVRIQSQKGTLAPVLYKGRIRRQSVCAATGYHKVGLNNYGGGYKRTLAVHKIVCEAWHGPRPHKQDAAHWSGVKSDNRPENLRWASRRDNLADRERHGTVNRGERNGMSKLSDAAMDEIRLRRSEGEMVKDLAIEFGVGKTHLSTRLSGRIRRKTHGPV